MISRWADYIITAVHYEPTGHNQECPRIVAVEVRMDLGGRYGYAEIWRREQVLNAVNLDHETFVTSSMGVDGGWVRGSHVRVIQVRGIDYIRANRNPLPQDDLGRIAEF